MFAILLSIIAWEKAEVDKKYQETGVYKRAQLRKVRSSLNDFQRFKVRVLKRQVS